MPASFEGLMREAARLHKENTPESRAQFQAVIGEIRTKHNPTLQDALFDLEQELGKAQEEDRKEQIATKLEIARAAQNYQPPKRKSALGKSLVHTSFATDKVVGKLNTVIGTRPVGGPKKTAEDLEGIKRRQSLGRQLAQLKAAHLLDAVYERRIKLIDVNALASLFIKEGLAPADLAEEHFGIQRGILISEVIPKIHELKAKKVETVAVENEQKPPEPGKEIDIIEIKAPENPVVTQTRRDAATRLLENFGAFQLHAAQIPLEKIKLASLQAILQLARDHNVVHGLQPAHFEGITGEKLANIIRNLRKEA